MIWIWTYMILACTQALYLGKLRVQGVRVEIQTEQSLTTRFTHHKFRLAGQYVLRSWDIKDTHQSFSKWDLELFL